ncbi:MAG: enoyl-CoA hydratase-related protein, partial [Propioniciclava sp.]
MIETTTLDGIATVRFDDGKVNVLDLATVTELAATLEERSRDARAIVLQGATRAFSAGVDLAGLLQADLAHTEAFLADLDAFVVALH